MAIKVIYVLCNKYMRKCFEIFGEAECEIILSV